MRKLITSLSFMVALATGIVQGLSGNWSVAAWALCAAAWIYSFAMKERSYEITQSILGKAITRLIELEGKEKTEKRLIGE